MNWLRQIDDTYRAVGGSCMRLFRASAMTLGVLGLVGVFLREHLFEMILGIFLPDSWIDVLRMTHQALFSELGGAILFQAVTAICFSTISLFFFRTKDRIAKEVEARQTGEQVPDAAVVREVWHEAGLILLTFNILSLVYLALYFSGSWVRSFFSATSVVATMVLFSLDMQSPVFFRRDLGAGKLTLGSLRRPLQTVAVGVAFCGPILLAEWALDGVLGSWHNTFAVGLQVVAIIAVNCFVCAFALPAGTLAGLHTLRAEPLSEEKALSRQRWFGRSQAALASLLVLFYLTLAGSMLRLVPLKNATYDVEWLSMGAENLLSGGPRTLRFDVIITNNHEHVALEVDRALLVLNYDDRLLGQVGLTIPSVQPQTEHRVTVELVVDISATEAVEIGAGAGIDLLLDRPQRWRQTLDVRLDLPVMFGVTWPLYLMKQ